MFYQTAKKYILKLIRIRKRLLLDGLNKREKTYLVEVIENLDRYLLAYNYSNYQFAGFWIKHNTEIAELIPGEGSKTHDKLLDEFNQLNWQAKQLRTNNNNKIIIITHVKNR